MNRDFKTTSIHQKWCTDITYIYTQKDGWTYLASVMDRHSKKILGYAYDVSITAVNNVCLNVKDIEGILLHSDLGMQYTSHAFEECLKEKGILDSFSIKGMSYDNACIESFHSILKKEEVNQKEYYDFKTAKQALFEYMESWYNHKRIHSAINYLIPQTAHSVAEW